MSSRLLAQTMPSGAPLEPRAFDIELLRLVIDLAEAVDAESRYSGACAPSYFHAQCEALLRFLELVPFEREGKFSSRDQRIVETIQTAEPSLNGQVAGSVRRGYRLAGRLVLPQFVVTYRYNKFMADKGAA